jgi:hypothetical protein
VIGVYLGGILGHGKLPMLLVTGTAFRNHATNITPIVTT